MANTTSTRTIITWVSMPPNWRMPRSNSVSGGRRVSRSAICPKAVSCAGLDDQDPGAAAAHVGAHEHAVRALGQAGVRCDDSGFFSPPGRSRRSALPG